MFEDWEFEFDFEHEEVFEPLEEEDAIDESCSGEEEVYELVIGDEIVVEIDETEVVSQHKRDERQVIKFVKDFEEIVEGLQFYLDQEEEEEYRTD